MEPNIRVDGYLYLHVMDILCSVWKFSYSVWTHCSVWILYCSAWNGHYTAICKLTRKTITLNWTPKLVIIKTDIISFDRVQTRDKWNILIASAISIELYIISLKKGRFHFYNIHRALLFFLVLIHCNFVVSVYLIVMKFFGKRFYPIRNPGWYLEKNKKIPKLKFTYY